MYSVFEIRVRVACNIPKLSFVFISLEKSEHNQTPSPKPSNNNDPTSVELYN